MAAAMAPGCEPHTLLPCWVKSLIIFSRILGYIHTCSCSRGQRSFTLWVTVKLSETRASFPLVLGHWAQMGPSILVSLSSLSLAVRGGQVWGKCPAGYFCPPGTSEVTASGPRESQTPCSQGQLCAEQCPPGNSPHFLPLGCERGRQQGCPAVTTEPTLAKNLFCVSQTESKNS